MKLFELVAVPLKVLTPIGPVVAFVGTLAVICVLESTVNTAPVPLKLTVSAEPKFVPLMTRSVFTGPLAGEKPLMLGGGLVWPSTLFLSAEATVADSAVKKVKPVSFWISLAGVMKFCRHLRGPPDRGGRLPEEGEAALRGPLRLTAAGSRRPPRPDEAPRQVVVDQAGCPYTGTRNDESSNWVRIYPQTGAPSARAQAFWLRGGD